MQRSDYEPYVSWIVDTAGAAYDPDDQTLSAHLRGVRPTDTLVVFNAGFEPMVVAVRDAYAGVVPMEEAESMAIEWLDEQGWFADPDEEHSAERLFPGKA